MKTARRLITFVASGYVLMFFSEYYFTNEEPAFTLIDALTKDITALVFLLEFVLLYTFFSYAMLIALKRFRIQSITGLILAGTLFGWWTEGVVIPVVYEALPITIFWPSVGWHVLVDVLIGWYLVRKLLHLNKWYLTIIVMIAMGTFWGIWATWFWSEEIARIESNHFIIYTFSTSILLIISYWVMDQYRFNSLAISKVEIYIFATLSVAFLTLLSFSYGLIPWLVLGPLTGITFYALYKGSKKYNQSSLSFDGKTCWWQYPILLLMPLIGSIVYNIVYLSKRTPVLGELVPPILLGIGVITYLVALYKNIR